MTCIVANKRKRKTEEKEDERKDDQVDKGLI